MANKFVVGSNGKGTLVPQSQADLDQQPIDDAAHTAMVAARTAEATRQGTLSGDAQVIDWINKLSQSSNADIDTYFANNVTTAAQAINVLKGVVKVLAYKLRVT